MPNLIKKRLKRISNRYLTLHFFYCQIKKFLRRDEVAGISPGITYYLIMGFIPFLIFSVNVVLFSTAADVEFVIEMLYAYFPPKMAKTLQYDVLRIVNQRSDIWLWVSLLVSAFSFGKALAILVRASDPKTYGERKKDSNAVGVKRSVDFLIFIKSMLYSVGLVIVIIASLGLTVFGKFLSEWFEANLEVSSVFLFSWNFIIYVIPFIALVLYLTIFYLTAPRSYTPRLSNAFVTAFVVTVMWLVATIFYRWVLMVIPSMGESYGPLFGLFTVFLWFFYIVTIIIQGLGILNAWEVFKQRLTAVRKTMEK